MFDVKGFLDKLIVKFDVIALSKTWLISNVHDLSDYDYDGYYLFTTSRQHKRGGGVALYVNEDFKCEKKLNNVWNLFLLILRYKIIEV